MTAAHIDVAHRTTVDPRALAEWTAQVEAARAAYHEDGFASSRASALREAEWKHRYGYLTRADFDDLVADITRCYPRRTA